jgi:tetratricopeptide (TPR) repeat protein
MKKVVLALVLGIATSTVCAVPVAFAQDQITIKDPAEYNAYSNAIGTSAPAAKAAALEDFLTKYPQTVVKLQVLNTLLTTYQQANDQANMLKTAKRVLDADPNNLRAAFIYVFLTKTQATAKAATDPAAAQPMFDDAATVAQAALKVTAPGPGTGVSADDFNKLKTATTPIFESAIATDDVGKKDYKDAIDSYTAELKSYPDLSASAGVPGINETYMLGQAYLQEDPKDLPDGIFYLARAAQYAPAAAKDGVEKAAEYWYKKYHGSMDGFDAVKQLAHDNAAPPDSYKPTPAPPPPSPEDLAHQALYPPPATPGGVAPAPTDIKTMALSDKEFVLTNGKQEDADAVWATMKGIRAEQIPGIVVAATPTSVQLAVSPDNQQATPKVADFTVNFTKPLTTVPTVGASVKYDGTFDSYTKTPPMIILNDGAVSGEKKPAAPRRRTAAH